MVSRPLVALTTTGAPANLVLSLLRSAIVERGWDFASAGGSERYWIRVTGRSDFDRGVRSGYELSATQQKGAWEIRWRPPSSTSRGQAIRCSEEELASVLRGIVETILPPYTDQASAASEPSLPAPSRSETARARIEELIGRCSLLLLERDDLVSWIEQLQRRNRNLTSENDALRVAIADAHGTIGELRGYVEVLRSQIAADRPLSPESSKHAAQGTSRAARVFEGALAGVLSGLVLIASTSALDDPPVTNQEVTTIVMEIQNSCTNVITSIEELPESG